MTIIDVIVLSACAAVALWAGVAIFKQERRDREIEANLAKIRKKRAPHFYPGN